MVMQKSFEAYLIKMANKFEIIYNETTYLVHRILKPQGNVNL